MIDDERIHHLATHMRRERLAVRELRIRETAMAIVAGHYGTDDPIRIPWTRPAARGYVNQHAGPLPKPDPLGGRYLILLVRNMTSVHGDAAIAQMLVEQDLREQLEELGL